MFIQNKKLFYLPLILFLVFTFISLNGCNNSVYTHSITKVDTSYENMYVEAQVTNEEQGYCFSGETLQGEQYIDIAVQLRIVAPEDQFQSGVSFYKKDFNIYLTIPNITHKTILYQDNVSNNMSLIIVTKSFSIFHFRLIFDEGYTTADDQIINEQLYILEFLEQRI